MLRVYYGGTDGRENWTLSVDHVNHVKVKCFIVIPIERNRIFL